MLAVEIQSLARQLMRPTATSVSEAAQKARDFEDKAMRLGGNMAPDRAGAASDARPPRQLIGGPTRDFAGARPGPSTLRSQPPLRSLLAIDAFAAFVPLLRLQRQRRDRTRVEPLEANRLARFRNSRTSCPADAGQCRVDLGDELALAVARPQLQRAVGLGGRTVGEVGVLWESPCSPASVSRVWRMISSFQASSFWRK